MSTNVRKTMGRWSVPATSVAIGLIYLVTAWLGGHAVTGLAMLAVMVAFALALVLARTRSETMRGIIESGDERFSGINTRATAAAGMIVIVAVLVAAAVQIGRGHSGAPYSYLAALGGLTYLAALAWENQRG
jgi:hypothetical protein